MNIEKTLEFDDGDFALNILVDGSEAMVQLSDCSKVLCTLSPDEITYLINALKDARKAVSNLYTLECRNWQETKRGLE